MGVHCSCPLAVHCDIENGFESAIVKSLNVGNDNQNPLGSGEMVASYPISSSLVQKVPYSPLLDWSSPKHEAAIKLQKVYKSFRTRRKLADCVVLIEQSWWKLLDFAELKHSSISFFDIDKHETAISRWSRARTMAAKLGKGLSKNGKAQKLALQHWLEAIDPRHRYGHNLHFYYVKWLSSQSREPFFYWLDIGEGKEVNLIEKCPRSKLQQQCIKYLGPKERKAYEVAVEDGKFFYKQTGELLDTTKESKGSKWIFVLSTSKTLYVGKKKKGSFQHSSFLAGGAILAAGRIVAEKGVLKAAWPHSGHYRPTPENFRDFLSFLLENNVDLTDVKLDSTDEEDEESMLKKECVYLRSNSSADDLAEKDHSETEENDSKSSSNEIKSRKEETASRMLHGFSRKLAALEIPSKDNLLEKLMAENQIAKSTVDHGFPLGSPMDGSEAAEESFALEHDHSNIVKNSLSTDDDKMKEESIPEDSIFPRINSDKETKFSQLGKQLSCQWSTGAGPRISCLRDYPSGLQRHALEQVNLSPRSKRRLRLKFSSRTSTSAGSNRSCNGIHHSSMQSWPVRRLTSPVSEPY
ncbi:hypothetical protein CDL12_15558 [Handroanthus impetiginosus]|uniref:IQ domain-containing protein IQM2-like n=1 Tax=Handroanthus impetiginosus TaxID=429701 RepID=A0A2G9H2U9_9LAMI|nr:hypothetical protein CDL12_15558 [Handroanthus impetiginosus]